jgi:hypothetical protein
LRAHANNTHMRTYIACTHAQYIGFSDARLQAGDVEDGGADLRLRADGLALIWRDLPRPPRIYDHQLNL